MIRSPLFSTKIIRIDRSNIYSNYHDWYGLLRLIFSIQLNRAISGHDSTAVTTLKPIERTWNMWRHAINTHNITWHAIDCVNHPWLLWCDNYSDTLLSISMVTSSNGNIFRVTGHLRGEFTAPRWIPYTRSFDVFFDLRLNKRLSKQWRGWWFETLTRPLWRHRNVKLIAFLASSHHQNIAVWIILTIYFDAIFTTNLYVLKIETL